MKKSTKVIKPQSRARCASPFDIPEVVYLDDSHADTPRSLPPLVPASEYLNQVANSTLVGTVLRTIRENEYMIESMEEKMDRLNRLNIDLRKNIVQLKLLEERALRYAPLTDSDDDELELSDNDGEYIIRKTSSHKV
jgi:hypothetical protein